MQNLEHTLDDLLVKKAPFQVPENGRRWLVKVLPWLTLIGGILALLVAAGAYQLLTHATPTGTFWSSVYAASDTTISPWLWISLVVIIVEAILSFIAFPALRTYKKRGWDILFWMTLANSVEGVLQFAGNGEASSLISSLLGSVIGLYLLFQVRAYYTGEKKLPVAAAAADGTMNVPKETPAVKSPAAGTSAQDDEVAPEKKA